MNLPNKLTLIRIALIPVFVAFFYLTMIPYNYVISAGVFALAAFTDFLDGYIARKYNLVTNLGKFLDPIADKVLVSTALIIMLLPFSGAILPWYCGIGVAIILARELVVSGFRMVAASKGLVLAAEKSGKIKTTVQDLAILVLLVGASVMPGLYTIFNIVGLVAFGLAVILTIYSGLECILKNKEVLKG
ncbi:MAG: CDP-diacylglycerol--glycerol-3-phosphate 3-phosphatidyltransferase [Clostridiales bacterium]|nr:CDP-diacylglycerol--glycerol-3-phosphate 3-phosphatidyltransferase [Clostridiales bacterium]